MFHRAPGTFTLILMALLVIAIMLVEMVDISCYRRRRRLRDDEEERCRRTTRRRLRTRALRIPAVTVYESAVVYESEKAPWKLPSWRFGYPRYNSVFYSYPIMCYTHCVYDPWPAISFLSPFSCIDTNWLQDTIYQCCTQKDASAFSSDPLRRRGSGC
jgi:hypothetical protein